MVKTELSALLALALEHSRRGANPTPWLRIEMKDLAVAISLHRTFTYQIRVFISARGAPTRAQIDYVKRALGLTPYREEQIPLFANQSAYLMISDRYDIRDADPYPSPV